MQPLARNGLRGQQVAGLRNVGRGGQGAGHALANVGVQDGVGVQPRDDAAHHGKGAHHAPFHRLRPLQQRAAHAKHQQCDTLCGRHIDKRGAPQAPEHHPPQCEEAGRPVPARQRAAHGVQPGKHGHVALGVHRPQGRPVQAGDGLVGRRLQGHMGNGWCGDQRGGHAAFWHAASASNAGKSTGARRSSAAHRCAYESCAGEYGRSMAAAERSLPKDAPILNQIRAWGFGSKRCQLSIK